MNLTKRINNEKLPEISGKKQAVHRDHGGVIERVAGVRDHYVLLRMAEHECEQALSRSGQDVCDRHKRIADVQCLHDPDYGRCHSGAGMRHYRIKTVM